MTKNKKLFFGAFAVIGVGAYLVYKFATKSKIVGTKLSGEKSKEGENAKEETKPKTIVDKVLPVASYPLKKGSTGSNVITLQKWLNDKGYASPKLVPDGSFGTKTENAVKSMQETPYEKNILDYIKKAMFSANYSYGEVSKDFYDIFVVKTKTISNSGGLF